MSLTVKLCNNSSPREKIGKTLSAGTLFDCLLKEGTSIYNPTIILKSSVDVYNYNYMYIPEFDRFYFMVDIVSNNNLWEVTGHVDVLETFKAGILANNAVLKRQQHKYNLYLDDPDFQTYNYEIIKCIKFEASEDLSKTLQFILVTDNKPGSSSVAEEVNRIESEFE